METIDIQRREYFEDGDFILEFTTVAKRKMMCQHDEDGAVYGWDEEGGSWALWLIKAPNTERYRVREGTLSMVNEALKGCPRLKVLEVPYSLKMTMEEIVGKCDHEIEVVTTLWPYNHEVSEELQHEIDEGWEDEQGYVYSSDLKRLLKAASCHRYKILVGVEQIDQLAFVGCKVDMLEIPYTCKELPEFLENCSNKVIGSIWHWDGPYPEDCYYTAMIEGEETWEDEAHVVYSKDRQRLLFAREGFDRRIYRVPDGVVTICSGAFVDCEEPVVLRVPPLGEGYRQ